MTLQELYSSKRFQYAPVRRLSSVDCAEGKGCEESAQTPIKADKKDTLPQIFGRIVPIWLLNSRESNNVQ